MSETPRSPGFLEPASLTVLGVLGAALLGGAIFHVAWYDFTTDDAFIFARYARNVVEGEGWVYNVGERVEGYTSFLWLALSSLLGLVGVDYVVAVRALGAVGALAVLATCVAAARALGTPSRSPAILLGALLVAANGSFVCWSLGGLETCGYAALVLATTVLAAEGDRTNRRLAATGVLAGLCTLARPDGLLVAAAVVIWVTVVRRAGARALAILGLPILLIKVPHFAWRLAYYGEWWPNTFYAKVGSGSEQVTRGLDYVASFAAENGGALMWAAPFAAVWCYRARPLARALSLVGLALLAGVVAVGGDGQPMFRFLVPIVPLWALLVQAVVVDLLRSLSVSKRWPAAGGLVLAVACLVGPELRQSSRSNAYQRYRYHNDVEVPRWEEVGRWLGETADPDASLACVPIGAVGYYSRLRVIDMLGLTDRHIAHSSAPLGGGWAGHEKHDGAYVLEQRPTYLLLGNIQVLEERLPEDSPYFVRPQSTFIRAREGDLFTPQLARRYAREVAELPGGLFLHYLRRRDGR